MDNLTALEALEVVRELAEKYMDIDQSHLTTRQKCVVAELLDQIEALLSVGAA